MTDDRKRLWRQRIRRVARLVLPLAAAELVSQLASSMGANLITNSPVINSLLAVLFGAALSLLLELRYRTRLDPDPEPDTEPDEDAPAALTTSTLRVVPDAPRSTLAAPDPVPAAEPDDPPPSPERRRLRGLHRRAVPVADELPESRELVGREPLCAEIAQQLDDERVLILNGAPNNGTSSVALACARRYPARRTVYLDLRSGPRRLFGAQQVVDAVLAHLGRPGVPIEEALRAEPILLVVDNVQHDEQVTPFVSATPPAGLTVLAGTGMGGAPAYPHVYDFVVTGLGEAAALELLGRETGRGNLAGDEHAKAIVAELGYQPTAICLLAQNIEADDRLSDWLPDTQVTDAVWRACWRAFELVHPVQLRLLRRMVAVAEVELDVAGVAALLRRRKSRPEVYELLRTLRRRQQIRQVYALPTAPTPGDQALEPRYLISDDWVPPLTDFVPWGRRSVRRESQRAVRRLLRHYAELAEYHAERLADSSARDWFQEYEATLLPLVTRWVPMLVPAPSADPTLAAKAGPPGLTRRALPAVAAIAAGLCRWYEATGDYRGFGDSNRTARAYRVAYALKQLAERYGAASHRAWALNQIGAIRRATGDQFGAQQRLGEAGRRPGWTAGGAQASTNLGLAELGRDPAAALYRAARGRQLRRRSDHAGKGHADLALAVAYLHSGGDGRFSHRRQAQARLEAALREFGRAGDPRGEACVLHNLGLLCFDTAPHRANQLFQEAHVRLVHGADPALAIQRALVEADLYWAHPAADRTATLARLAEARGLADRYADPDLGHQLDAFLTTLTPG